MADGTTKKAPAKRTSTQKSGAKKSSTAKTSTKKAGTKKASAKRAGAKKADHQQAPARKASARTEAPRRSDARGGPRGRDVASHARAAVLDLTGRTPEAVTGLERSDDGWTVDVEVLELERIPSTTDVLATYRVTLDGDGELAGCRRVRRYLRGTPGDE